MKSDGGRPAALRRQHDRAFKAELVQQCLQPGASVSAIALRNGVNANMLFRWRRELGQAAATPSRVALVPVQVVAEDRAVDGHSRADAAAGLAAQAAKPMSRQGTIELDVDGVQLRLRGAVDEDSLCSVLRALRRSA